MGKCQKLQTNVERENWKKRAAKKPKFKNLTARSILGTSQKRGNLPVNWAFHADPTNICTFNVKLPSFVPDILCQRLIVSI